MSGLMFPVQAERFLGSSRLGGYRHVGLRLNDGGNAEAHDGVIVADENFDFLNIIHSLHAVLGSRGLEMRTPNAE